MGKSQRTSTGLKVRKLQLKQQYTSSYVVIGKAISINLKQFSFKLSLTSKDVDAVFENGRRVKRPLARRASVLIRLNLRPTPNRRHSPSPRCRSKLCSSSAVLTGPPLLYVATRQPLASSRTVPWNTQCIREVYGEYWAIRYLEHVW